MTSRTPDTSEAAPCYYDLLGVDRDCDAASLKKAYRKLAIKHHPDKNPNNPAAAQTFQAVSEAYEVLSDPEKRSVYDQYGRQAVEQMDNGGSGGGRPMNPSDIFAQMFGGMDPFGGGPRGEGSQSHRKPPASRTEVDVDLSVLCLGGDLTVPFSDTVAKNLVTGETCTAFELCAACRGLGSVMQTRMIGPGMIQQSQGPCMECETRGYTLQSEVAGDCIWMDEIKDHTTHLMAGRSLREPLVLYEKGRLYVDADTGTVRRGDLHVRLNVKPTEDGEWQLYSPRHRHLQWTPKLQVIVGLLTNRLRCTHPDGTEYVFEMPTTERTDAMVVTGKGLPATEHEPAGDLFIRVQWLFDTAMLSKADWFVQMQKGLHKRAPWSNPSQYGVHATCMTSEDYAGWQEGQQQQRGQHRAHPEEGHEEGGHSQGPRGQTRGHRAQGIGGGGGGPGPECVQS